MDSYGGACQTLRLREHRGLREPEEGEGTRGGFQAPRA